MRIGRAAALTDTGRRRLDNEDAFVIEPPLFAVADGMGGALAGEVAARIAVTTIEERGVGLREPDGLRDLLRLANTRIFERAVTDPGTTGMGTTATLAAVDEAAGTVVLAHVGDSRAYRLRGGVLEQLTDDHSLVGELVREGRLTPDEAFVHPARSVITRVLGTDPEVEVDLLSLPAEPGDVFLLCSDGLSEMLRDEEIATLARDAGSPEGAAEALVAAANAAGGDDNVTVVVFEVLEGEAPERPAPPPPLPDDGEAALGEDGPATPGARSALPVVAADDVSRHGASDGSRWPALLLLAAIVLVGALALWWGITR